MVLRCADPGGNEDYPEYSDYNDSDYPDKYLRFIDLFFMRLIPVRENDEVIFIEHNRPVGYGTVLVAENVDPETFFGQFEEEVAATLGPTGEDVELLRLLSAYDCESPVDTDISGSGKEYWEDEIGELITVLDSFSLE